MLRRNRPVIKSVEEVRIESRRDSMVGKICERGRDEHETSLAETETLASRERDVGLTSRDETRRLNFETRARRDVCRSRDVTETLKCTLSLMQY